MSRMRYKSDSRHHSTRLSTRQSRLGRSQPHIVLVRKQFVMERQADGVGTLLLDEADVLARYIIVLECFPEVGRKVRSHQLAEHLIDETSGIGLVELEHVSFRIQPVTQVVPMMKSLVPSGFIKS